jgi:hypothetical protein
VASRIIAFLSLLLCYVPRGLNRRSELQLSGAWRMKKGGNTLFIRQALFFENMILYQLVYFHGVF